MTCPGGARVCNTTQSVSGFQWTTAALTQCKALFFYLAEFLRTFG